MNSGPTEATQQDPVLKQKVLRSLGEEAQWYSACLACLRPWDPGIFGTENKSEN